MPLASEPYLSIVVTARNDDHGGNLLRRMQIFLRTLGELVARNDLPVELLLVEWNPPSDRPRLHEALDWSHVRPPLQVRIIEIPADVHRRYRHAEALPLYQMIAKNVGILRSRGRFVLATNVDVVFSTELFAFFAQRDLDPSRMYRIDRIDVDEHLPLDAELEERLAYCASHILRNNTREGCHSATPDGLRSPLSDDIIASPDSVFLGSGWYEPEGAGRRRFRWAAPGADLLLRPSNGSPGRLSIELAPGPGVGFEPFDLRIVQSPPQATAVEARIEGRTQVTIATPSSSGDRRFRFETADGGSPSERSGDGRVLNFRVFRAEWVADAGAPSAESPVETIAVEVRAMSPLRDALRRALRRLLYRLRPTQSEGALEPPIEFEVHLNACGDFTLLSRAAWLNLRGYPELDRFSMNLDSVFCFAAHFAGYRELVLADPLRLYHIEHAVGSGFTPEGRGKLYRRVAAQGIPWLSSSEVFAWARQMRRFATPMIFNQEDWGLADLELPERVIRE